MSKRHIIENTLQPIPPVPSEVLFQENLVFYAPLNKGELFDYISGEVGTTSEYAWTTWDDNEQMYQLGFDYPTYTGHNCSALRFTSSTLLSNLNRCFIGGGGTVMMRYKDVEYVGNRWSVTRALSIDAMPDVWEYDPRSNITIDGYRQYQQNSMPAAARIFRTVIATFKTTGSQFKTYVDGTLKTTSSFGMMASPRSVGICDKNGDLTNNNSYYNAKKYVIYTKDIRVYDRQMTASEVQQLTNNVI